MSVPFGKFAFTTGEVSPSLFGREDFAKLSSAASTMRNAFVSYRGGASSRAGTAFVGFSKQTGRTLSPRLITFQFSSNQGLVLEFGNHYMRVISNGALVTEDPLNIIGIIRGTTTRIEVTAHGYSVGDWVFITGVVGAPQYNGQTYVIDSVLTNSFTITDVFGIPINSTNYGIWMSGGTTARIYTLTTPYGDADLPYLKFTQSADVMSLCCWNQATGTSYEPRELTRDADDNWTLVTLDTSAKIAPPASISGVASVIDPGTPGMGLGAGTAYAYVVTAIDKTTGDESVASPRVDITNSVDIAVFAGSLQINWSQVDGAGYYHVYKAPPAYAPIPGNLGYSYPVPAGALFGYAGTTYGTQFIDTNIIPDYSQVPPLYLDPFAPGQVADVVITSGGSNLTTVTWAVTSGAGTGFDGYPVVVGGSLTAFVITNAGKNYQPGDAIAFNGAAFASGAIVFGVNPADGDTITLNAVVWTFKTTPTLAHQTKIAGTLALTLSQLGNDLSASGAASLTVANYNVTATALNVTYKTAGAAGDAYTLAASVATPSGPHLTGGAGPTGTAPAATLLIGPETGTYPSCVAYFQERRVYAGTPNSPDTYFMTQPGLFSNFDSRIPTIDTDAIQGSPWSVQVNGIQFMVSMPGGLVVLTGLSAWQLTGVGGSSLNPQPITPANQQAQPQAYNGCSATVPPFKVDNDIIYLQAQGSIFRDFSYNFFTNIYTGSDLTVLSSHLFTGHTIRESAWCEEPYKIMWAVRDDGIMLSMTYVKPEEVLGWARHDTRGLFKSVCSVREPPADALYMATQRTSSGNKAFFLEWLDDRIWPTVEDAWCVDAALRLPMTFPTSTLSISSSTGAGTLTGVTFLHGGTGYSSATTATVIDNNGEGPGTGAVVALTIVGGVITAVVFTAGGSGYVSPALAFFDPTNSGSGASAKVTLDSSAVFTSTASDFAPNMVGWAIRAGGGVAIITDYTGGQRVTARITQPFNTLVNDSDGSVQPQTGWSLSNPTNTITGLNHLIGETVTGLADGSVIPPTVVDSTGSISLPRLASAVTVGLGFQVQVQSVYLDAGNPTVQGQRKKISAVTARVQASRDFLVGSNQPDGSTLSPIQIAPTWTDLDEPEAPQNVAPSFYNSTFTPLYTGDARIPISGGYQKQGQACIEQSNPLPLTVLAFVNEVLGGDSPQAGFPAKQPRK